MGEIPEEIWEAFLTGWRMGYRDGKHDFELELRLKPRPSEVEKP